MGETERQAEVEVPRRTLTLLAAALAVAGLAALGWTGWANSPRGGDGRPLLLTPERRAILRYLNAAAGWAARLGEVGTALDGLTPLPTLRIEVQPTVTAAATATLTLTMDLPTPPALPALVPPEAQPADLYRRTHEAQAARAVLETLAREVEQARTPDALAGLCDSLVLPALETHVAWADGVLAYVGAPESVATEELNRLRDEAQTALAALEEALSVER